MFIPYSRGFFFLQIYVLNLQIYPGANHDLNYMDLDGNKVDALKHLYTSMEDFFDKDCNFADENSLRREIER